MFTLVGKRWQRRKEGRRKKRKAGRYNSLVVHSNEVDISEGLIIHKRSMMNGKETATGHLR